MGAKPKTASWVSRNKKLVVASVIVLTVLLLGFLYYQSQRPNYRDLEKAFSQLQIPAEWELSSTGDNKGTWGLFCLQNTDTGCPQLVAQFKVPVSSVSVIDGVKALLGSEFSLVKFECINNEISCTATFKNNDIYVSVISSKDGDKFVTINLIFGNKNGIGT